MRPIDADALKGKIFDRYPHFRQRISLSPVLDEIENAPILDSVRKKGKWILKPNIYGVAYCSECDYELHTDNTNYCPNCGADMRERKED